MSETKFTPGPWRYEQEGQKIWAKSVGGVRMEEANHMIADIRGWGHLQYLSNGEKVQDANGFLIAAAPDMYKELEEALNVFRFYQFHHASKGHSEKEQNNKQYADNIEKVLAKARGEG